MPVATQGTSDPAADHTGHLVAGAACLAVMRAPHENPAHRVADAVEFIGALEGARA